MMQDIGAIDNSKVAAASFDGRLFQKILDEVAKYKSNTADPLKSTEKQKMAREIMAMGLQFVNEVDSAGDGVIDMYVNTVDKLLQSDQRQKLAEGAHDYLEACVAHRVTLAAPGLGNAYHSSYGYTQ